MFGVIPGPIPPLPQTGPVILVSDHSTLGDPLVLIRTAGRPIKFLMAREIYEQRRVRWVFRAFNCIPVSRGTSDTSAVRAMLKALQSGQVVGLFPEGGIDNNRRDDSHVGVAYLALKTGSPIVPTSIQWASERPSTMWQTILTRGKVQVQYGSPLHFPQEQNPNRERLQDVTHQVMEAIRELQKKYT